MILIIRIRGLIRGRWKQKRDPDMRQEEADLGGHGWLGRWSQGTQAARAAGKGEETRPPSRASRKKAALLKPSF